MMASEGVRRVQGQVINTSVRGGIRRSPALGKTYRIALEREVSRQELFEWLNY
jgi:hypothetical protein